MTVVSCDQKSHVTSKFDCLDLRNVKVIFLILTTSCDANASVNGMTWQEKSCCISFLSLWPKECNDAVGIKWHWHWHWMNYMTKKVISHFTFLNRKRECNRTIDNAVSMMLIPMVTHDQKSCCTSFWVYWPKDCSGAITSAVCITWCWCQCRWHHMSKKVMLYLTSYLRDLKDKIGPFMML